MRDSQKQEIKKLTQEAIQKAGSQNKYSTQIGVSAGQIINLLTDKWDLISDAMWKKLAKGCGFTGSNWEMVETRAFKSLLTIYRDAKAHGSTFGMVGPAGCGKTSAARWFKANHSNVFLLECAEYWNKKGFLSEMLKAMGAPWQGFNLYELMEAVESEMLKRDSTLIILDEADKLKDEVLYFFITLYNRLDGKCGIVMQSTEFMQRRVTKGLRLGKKGYTEIYSRIGRRFVSLPEPNTNDITKVCIANGLDKGAVSKIVQECEGDLRRVYRLIHAEESKRKEVSHAA